jgi:protein phosphatase
MNRFAANPKWSIYLPLTMSPTETTSQPGFLEYPTIGEGIGICYTRTGRRFFDDAKIEKDFLQQVRTACDAAGLWEQFQKDWICLDAELMPWSAKAQELLRQQYAAVGAAEQASLSETVASLEQLAPKNGDALVLLVEPFHLLATIN